MRIRTGFAAVATLAGLATFGLAAIGLPAAASAAPFNGPTVGAELGWQQDRLKSAPFDAKKSSLMGGAFAGYDATVGAGFVLGGEVAFDLGGKYGAQRIGGVLYEAKAQHSVSASVRAGALLDPATLLYAKGGYVNTRFKARVPAFGLTDTDNDSGFLVGAGVARALTENVSARLEYQYHGYGDGVSRHQLAVGLGYHF